MNNSGPIEQVNALLKSVREKDKQIQALKNIILRLGEQREVEQNISMGLHNLLSKMKEVEKNTKLSYKQRFKKVMRLLSSSDFKTQQSEGKK